MKNKKGFTPLNSRKANLTGFTLIELLIVIAIITILSAAIVVGINPARHFASARNATRWSQMNAIATAIYSYAVDNGGAYPTDPDADEYCIGPADSPEDIGTDPELWCYDSANSVNLLVPDYLRTLPEPPLAGDGEVYMIEFVDANENAIKITSSEGDEEGEEAEDVVLIQ